MYLTSTEESSLDLRIFLNTENRIQNFLLCDWPSDVKCPLRWPFKNSYRFLSVSFLQPRANFLSGVLIQKENVTGSVMNDKLQVLENFFHVDPTTKGPFLELLFIVTLPKALASPLLQNSAQMILTSCIIQNQSKADEPVTL